uniref:Putative serine/threonine protein kinase n=1 Tax=Pithovirus LCPAC406 TaxID=2506599 RepID=A0A481ZG07_9VIRU|nr:MAG: putative serine/threonine protein kinase [Pithovirus LCPAC406]
MSRKYERISRLGMGAFANVYKCYDRKSRTYKAIKVVKGNDGEGLNSLMEYFMVKHINHRYLIYASESYITDNTLYMVQEMGVNDLFDWRRKNVPTNKQIREWIFQLVDALLCLWSLDVTHTDLKTNNILLMKDGKIRLCDFGLSKLISKEQVLSCSPEHRPPEVWRYGDVSTSIDIWGLGCTIFEIIYGRTLFEDAPKETSLENISQWDKVRRDLIDHKEVKSFKRLPSSFSVDVPIDSFILFLVNPDLDTRPSGIEILTHPFMKGFTSSTWSVKNMRLHDVPLWIRDNRKHYTRSKDIYNLSVKIFSQLQNQRIELSIRVGERELFETCIFISYKLLRSTSKHPSYKFITLMKDLIRYEEVILKECEFTIFSLPHEF